MKLQEQDIKKLQSLRVEVDVIDKEICGLVLKRLRSLDKIFVIKKDNQLDVLDPQRTRQMLDKIKAEIDSLSGGVTKAQKEVILNTMNVFYKNQLEYLYTLKSLDESLC